MPSIKRLFFICLWWGFALAQNFSDGSTSVDPSHFFVTSSFITLEDLLADSPELEEAFYKLSSEERVAFAECIALLGETFLAHLLKDIAQSSEKEFPLE